MYPKHQNNHAKPLPELNLEPHDNVYGFRRYESGLMRVAFARGNPSYAKKLFGGPVLSDSEPFRSLLMKEKIGIDNWNKDFHNYSLVWKPSKLMFCVLRFRLKKFILTRISHGHCLMTV